MKPSAPAQMVLLPYCGRTNWPMQHFWHPRSASGAWAAGILLSIVVPLDIDRALDLVRARDQLVEPRGASRAQARVLLDEAHVQLLARVVEPRPLLPVVEFHEDEARV